MLSRFAEIGKRKGPGIALVYNSNTIPEPIEATLRLLDHRRDFVREESAEAICEMLRREPADSNPEALEQIVALKHELRTYKVMVPYSTGGELSEVREGVDVSTLRKLAAKEFGRRTGLRRPSGLRNCRGGVDLYCCVIKLTPHRQVLGVSSMKSIHDSVGVSSGCWQWNLEVHIKHHKRTVDTVKPAPHQTFVFCGAPF